MSISENEDIAHPLVELSDVDRVKKWASSKKINDLTVAELIKHGYDSIEALSCILPEDIVKTKIPIGQQRLVVRAVKSTFQTGDKNGSNLAAENPFPASSAGQSSNACATDSTEGAPVETGSSANYVQEVIKQLQLQQTLQGGDNITSNNSQQGLISASANQEGIQGFDCVSNIVSWKDPQIFLKSSFNDVTINFYDIT
ncbi:unnamed protein product [Mytilus coruscus]|uniref:SAM domain-containing protein n=1 Tax=Mytilus coruscus TaxID=42192 RepID=A0A6J8C2L2_MYTCO|nr:unnamed protein product [Mytilus coruscus]